MMDRIRTIVVGVHQPEEDGSASGDDGPALSSAVSLARAVGASLHVVHSYWPPASALPRGCLPPADPGSRAVREAEVGRSLAALRGRFPELAIETHAEEGSPATVLCDVAARVGADLLVVGSSPRGRLWRRITGSTTEGVVRGASVPVLVAHEPIQLPLGRVLLTTDLTAESVALLKRGIGSVGTLAGPETALRLLLVLSLEPRIPRPHWEELLMRDSGEVLSKVAGELGVPVETRIRAGDTGWQIVQEAEEWKPDLLLLGVHGRGGLRRLWLGGTAAAALRGTPANLLAIPAAAVDAAEVPTRRAKIEREREMV